MNRSEARDLLLVMAGSLRDDPPSFKVEVNLTGMRVSNSGGIGVLASPTGGGPGSTTIGVQASANAGDIDARVAAINDELRAQVTHAADVIAMIASEIERDKPDEGLIDRLVQQLPSQLVGAVVSATVSAIVAAVR